MKYLITSLLLSALYAASIIPSALAYHRGSDDWTGWGGSIYNDRSSDNKHISASTLKNVTVHCKHPHPGGVSATPVLAKGIAYYPTYGGSFVAFDFSACKVKWEINVTSIILDFAAPTVFQRSVVESDLASGMLTSRTSPQIDSKNDVLYFGTQLHALVVALDVNTGALLGTTQINTHPVAVIPLSPTLYNNILYIGTSSLEELVPTSVPGYKCCSFVGNAVALTFARDTKTWHTVWNQSMLPAPYTTPNETGWSGVGVWGSQPAIDVSRGRVFFATGNVYSSPPAYVNCTDDNFSPSTTAQNSSCLPDRVWQNAVMAVELVTGKVAWMKRFGPLDVWNLACGLNGTATDVGSCPGTPGPDYDFGMAPTFVPCKDKSGRDVLTIGQKSGYLYSLAADTGDVLWATLTSPGGEMGGLSWGVATDEKRVYFTGTNSGFHNFTLQPDSHVSTNNSIWGAASLADGKILWETKVAGNMIAYAPPTAVGDVVFVGRVTPLGPITSGDGPLVVLDKESGKIVLEMPLNGTLRGGFAVHDRYVLFGTGYKGTDGFLYVLKVDD